MTASDPLPGVASMPATRAAANLTAEIQYLGPDLHDTLIASDGTRTPCSSRDASSELGYGCVDWFIYVADSGSAATQLRLSGED